MVVVKFYVLVGRVGVFFSGSDYPYSFTFLSFSDFSSYNCVSLFTIFCLLSFVDVFCPQSMFASYSSNMFSWTRRFCVMSYLLLFVFCCLGNNFLSVQAFLLPRFVGGGFFSVRSRLVFFFCTLCFFWILSC